MGRISGVLTQCAGDTDADELRLRTAAIPELPAGFAPVEEELQSIGTILRSQSVDLRWQANDLTRRAERMASDQASATARLFGPNACRPIPPHESYWDGVKHRAGEVWNLAVGDDLETIRDPRQPLWERSIAVLGLLPVGTALKGVKLADDAFKVERDTKPAADAARAAQAAEKAEDVNAEWRAARGARAGAARKLEANMVDAGMGEKLPGYETHHIVPAFAPGAKRAQDALAHAGIGPNDAANGVYLPGPTLKGEEPLPSAVFHRPIHTTAYYSVIAARLQAATNRDDAIRILARIREQLERNTFPGETTRR